MVPMAYWKWQISRCRERDAGVYFMAEAYDGDPSKLFSGNVLDALLDSGFDAVLSKPFPLRDLVEWVKKLTTAPPKGELGA